MTEVGPGFLPFSSGPPSKGFWGHYQDAVNSYPPAPPVLPNEVPFESASSLVEDFDDQPQFDYEPDGEIEPLPPTREELLSDLTADHESNLAYLDMLPLDDDVREGLKNHAIDKYERKLREWLG